MLIRSICIVSVAKGPTHTSRVISKSGSNKSMRKLYAYRRSFIVFVLLNCFLRKANMMLPLTKWPTDFLRTSTTAWVVISYSSKSTLPLATIYWKAGGGLWSWRCAGLKSRISTARLTWPFSPPCANWINTCGWRMKKTGAHPAEAAFQYATCSARMATGLVGEGIMSNVLSAIFPDRKFREDLRQVLEWDLFRSYFNKRPRSGVSDRGKKVTEL